MTDLPTPLACQTPAEATDAVLQLLGAARHRMCLYSPDLMPAVTDNERVLAALRRLVQTGGRHGCLRLLAHDPAKLQRDGHRVLGLAQRLPSRIELRVVVEAADLAFAGAYLLADGGGYLRYPRADQPGASGSTRAPGAHRALLQHFDSAWERAVVSPLLRPLSL